MALCTLLQCTLIFYLLADPSSSGKTKGLFDGVFRRKEFPYWSVNSQGIEAAKKHDHSANAPLLFQEKFDLHDSYLSRNLLTFSTYFNSTIKVLGTNSAYDDNTESFTEVSFDYITNSDTKSIAGTLIEMTTKGYDQTALDNQTIDQLFPNVNITADKHTDLGDEIKNLSQLSLSWLDAFLCNHRNVEWLAFNLTMVFLDGILCLFALYRLIWLKTCTVLLPKTYFLIIHLLIFSILMFRVVQLLHFSFGNQEGIPLALTLILTHSPMTCLILSTIATVHRVLVVSQDKFTIKYLTTPRLLTLGMMFLVGFSITGDIIVGATYSHAVLLCSRLVFLVLVVLVFFVFIVKYFMVIKTSQFLQSDLECEEKLLSFRTENSYNFNKNKMLIRRRLLSWAQSTIASVLLLFIYVCFNFAISVFFTVPYVSVFLYWFCHSVENVFLFLVSLSLIFAANLTQNEYSVCSKRFYLSLLLSNYQRKSGNSYPDGRNIISERGITKVCIPETLQRNVITEDEVGQAENSSFNNAAFRSFSHIASKPRATIKRSATFNAPPRPYQAVCKATQVNIPAPGLFKSGSTSLLPIEEDSPNVHDDKEWVKVFNRLNYDDNKLHDKASPVCKIFRDKNINLCSSDRASSFGGSCSDSSFPCTLPPPPPSTPVQMAKVICRLVDPKEVSNLSANQRNANIPLTTFSSNLTQRIAENAHGFQKFPKSTISSNSPLQVTTVSTSAYLRPLQIPVSDIPKNEIYFDHSLKPGNVSIECNPFEISKTSLPTTDDESQENEHSSDTLTPNTLSDDSRCPSSIESSTDKSDMAAPLRIVNMNCDSGNVKQDEEFLAFSGISCDSSKEVLPGNASCNTHNSKDSPNLKKASLLKRNKTSASCYAPCRQHSFSAAFDEAKKLSSIRLNKHLRSNYSWYGTWSGRRKSKNNGGQSYKEEEAAYSDIGDIDSKRTKFYGRGSLSSIYGRIKAKRTAESQAISKNCPENGDSDVEFETKDYSPKIDEDVHEFDKLLSKVKGAEEDWTLEMIKSSELLADFFSADDSRVNGKISNIESDVGKSLEVFPI